MNTVSSLLFVVLLPLALSVGGAYVWFSKQAERFLRTAVEQRVLRQEACRPEKPWDFWTPEMENVAKELAEQRNAFARREAELASRETRIAAERKAVEEARAAVEKLRTEIDARLVQVHAQEQKNLKSLVATYSKLSPPAAVAIFKQMDDTTVAKLLALMKPEITTAVFEEYSREPGVDDANVRRVVELTQRMRLLMPLPDQTAAAR
jgi:flagellar motility protein MotE (MotC chaperone)